MAAIRMRATLHGDSSATWNQKLQIIYLSDQLNLPIRILASGFSLRFSVSSVFNAFALTDWTDTPEHGRHTQ
jgi:hypothetical protein